MSSCVLQFCIYGQVTAIFSNFLFVFLISVSLTSEPESLDDVDATTSCRKRKKINQTSFSAVLGKDKFPYRIYFFFFIKRIIQSICNVSQVTKRS